MLEVRAKLRLVRPICCLPGHVISCCGFSSANSLRPRIPRPTTRIRIEYTLCLQHDTFPRCLRTSSKQRRIASQQRKSENAVYRPNNVESSFDYITFSLDRRNEPITSNLIQFLSDSGHVHGQRIVVDETFVLP